MCFRRVFCLCRDGLPFTTHQPKRSSVSFFLGGGGLAWCFAPGAALRRPSVLSVILLREGCFSLAVRPVLGPGHGRLEQPREPRFCRSPGPELDGPGREPSVTQAEK